jgi:hypothetical protein
MPASEKSCKTVPHIVRGAFLCLVLISFLFSSKAFAGVDVSSFGAGPQQASGVHCVSVNFHPVSRPALAKAVVVGHSCPCPPCDHNTLTCCGSIFCSHFWAILSEVAFPAEVLQVAVILGEAMPSASSSSSQVFRPPKFANQA